MLKEELKIIDLSKHNGQVDFQKVKDSGVYGLIQRMGYGDSYVDPTAIFNIESALEQGLKVGAYWFIYSYSVEEAIKEADFFNKQLEPFRGKLELPVFADYEYDSDKYAEKNGVIPDKRLRTDVIKAFLDRLESYGWLVGNYGNVDYYKNKWFQNELDQYILWIADWRLLPDRSIIKKAGLWQFTSKGNISGVQGPVDVSLLNVDFSEYIRNNKLNGFS